MIPRALTMVDNRVLFARAHDMGACEVIATAKDVALPLIGYIAVIRRIVVGVIFGSQPLKDSLVHNGVNAPPPKRYGTLAARFWRPAATPARS